MVTRRKFSRSIILIVLGSALAMATTSISLVPPPQNYQLEEYAWIKESGTGTEHWWQHNDTGPNMLDLTYRHSSCDLAYVARTTGGGSFNITFIIYHNSSSSSGFNSTGHLFPGSQANWTQTLPSQTQASSGEYIYHLFVTTFDPGAVPGIYQLRINETGPGSGSSWAHPDGNPSVPWMFFSVPTAEPVVNVTDQLGREGPFFIDGISPATQLHATISLEPPGNDTGAPQALFEWISPYGQSIKNRSSPVQYLPGVGWFSEDVIDVNGTAFPANGSHSYMVRLRIGAFLGSESFQVLSGQWVEVNLSVAPILGQWFDPSSFKVSFSAVINTGVPANPYRRASNLTLQLFRETFRGVVANLSWDISGYPVVPGSSYTYTWTGMIPAGLIDTTGNGSQEFTGIYRLRTVPPQGYPALTTETSFYVDDPMESYTSLERGSVLARSAFEVNSTLWINIEMDPVLLRNRQHANEPFSDKTVTIYWDWPSPPPDQIKTDTVTATMGSSNPSEQHWASAQLVTNDSYPEGFYRIRASALCNTGYRVWEWKYIDMYRLRPPPPTETPNQPPYTIIRPRSNSSLWHTDLDDIRFNAADPPPDGSGIRAIYYQMDNGPVNEYTQNNVLRIAPAEGSHIYTFWSEDRAGNAEVPRTATINLDTVPPQTTISPSPGPEPYDSPVVIQLAATDPDPGSGIDVTYLSIDSSTPVVYTGGVLALDGDHTYTYWSRDIAGNAEEARQARIVIVNELALLAMLSLCAAVVLNGRA